MSSVLDEILEKQEDTKSLEKNNFIGTTLYNVGITILGIGILASIFIIVLLKDPASRYSFAPDPHPLRWVYGFSVFISTLFSGLLFLGFSEVINLLDKIHKSNSKPKNHIDD